MSGGRGRGRRLLTGELPHYSGPGIAETIGKGSVR